MDKEKIIENLTGEQEEKLKSVHSEDYMGTDDDMPDNYEVWLEELEEDEIKIILKEFNND